MAATGGITEADALSGSGAGAQIGSTKEIIDGPNKGVEVRWYIPAGATAPTWCWHVYPQSQYQG
jgi:hypothetical protein